MRGGQAKDRGREAAAILQVQDDGSLNRAVPGERARRAEKRDLSMGG